EAAQSSNDQSNGPVTPPSPSHSLSAPLPPSDAVREDFSKKRLPFYKFLRDKYSPPVEHFAVTEQLDTLDLQVSRGDTETLQFIIANAVAPTAREYGFRKVRFYVANPSGSVQPNTLIAESTDDGTGHWNTFRK